MSMHNKLLLYSQVIKVVGRMVSSFGAALNQQNNVRTIQKFRNKVLRNIKDAPWHIRNIDFNMYNTVRTEIKRQL